MITRAAARARMILNIYIIGPSIGAPVIDHQEH